MACGGFLSPHFLFSWLIGLRISMCCDSVSFDFIKPATTVARFIQYSFFVYILILFLVGKYVTGNASRARAELGLVLNTCLDIKVTNTFCAFFVGTCNFI